MSCLLVSAAPSAAAAALAYALLYAAESRGRVPHESVDAIEQWIERRQRSLHRANLVDESPVVCGWMRKSGQSSLKSKNRWVVLDGTSLMYYEDKAVRTRLCG